MSRTFQESGIRGQRGASEVFGYVPEGFTLAQMEALATKLFKERKVIEN